MKPETLTKFRKVAANIAWSRNVDADDILQEVLLNLVERGLDPEENQGLVITKLHYRGIDAAKQQVMRDERPTDFYPGWAESIRQTYEEELPARPGRKTARPEVVPSHEEKFAEEATIGFIEAYVGAILEDHLTGLELEIATEYYLNGKTYNEMQWSKTMTGVYLHRARKRLSEDQLETVAAWDAFNRSGEGRRRLDAAGAPGLISILFKEGML